MSAVGTGPGRKAGGQLQIPAHVKARIRGKLKRIEEISRARKTVVQGNLQFMDLKSLREKLGDRWPGIRIRLYELIDLELEKSLTEADEYLRTTDEFYFLVFGDRDRETIIHDLTLIGEKVASALEKEGVTTLDVVNVGARAKASDDFLDSFAAMRELFQGNFGSVDPAKGKAQGRKQDTQGIGALCSVRYQPVFDVTKEAILGYHVRLSDKAGEKEFSYRMLEGQGLADLQVRYACDLWLASSAIRFCARLHEENQIFYFVLPVSYATVSSKKQLSELVRLWSSKQEILKRIMILELTEVPSNLPASRLQYLNDLLKSYAASLMINCGAGVTSGFRKYSQSGIKLVGLDLKMLGTMSVSKRYTIVQMMKDAAKSDGLDILMYHIDDREYLELARREGIKLVAGSTIGRRRIQPTHMTPVPLQDFFDRRQ